MRQIVCDRCSTAREMNDTYIEPYTLSLVNTNTNAFACSGGFDLCTACIEYVTGEIRRALAHNAQRNVPRMPQPAVRRTDPCAVDGGKCDYPLCADGRNGCQRG